MINVLIVDDSALVRNNLKRQIEELGHKVVALAKSGKEAIVIYEKLKPDLVTMDITMPMMSGVSALKKIKEIDKDAKVIMITSHGEEDLVMESIKSGANGYVLKPITHAKLNKAIERNFPAWETEEV